MQKEKAVGIIGCVFVLMAMLISGYAVAETNSKVKQYTRIGLERIESIAIADVDSRGKTYVITSAIKDIDDEDLEFKVVARYIRNALSQKGYKQVDSKENADLLIRLAYGEGEPQTTTSTYTAAPGYSYPVGWYRYYVPSITQTVQTTNYTTSLVLAAYDLKTPGKLPQIWKTTLTHTGMREQSPTISQVRYTIRAMITAAIPYFGGNIPQINAPVYIDCPEINDIEKE